jgi:hypothetical protein
VSKQPPAGIGTAYFPDADIPPNGASQAKAAPLAPGRLRGLPRRRRPAMLALAVAMAGTGVLVSATLYQRTDHQVSVVMVTGTVPPGAVITSADVSTADVNVPAGIGVIPASQLGQVTGQIAAVELKPGTLLAPSELTTAQPPAPGQVLVPVPVKPNALPASGLAPGDQVLIVATPGDQGDPGSSSGAAPLASPVPCVVAAVNTVTDQNGFDVVDLLVAAASGPAVAEQASTGQFALIVTKRGS